MAIDSIATAISSVISEISVWVGGLFGIYLIQVILRALFYQRVLKNMKEMKNDINDLKKRFVRGENEKRRSDIKGSWKQGDNGSPGTRQKTKIKARGLLRHLKK